ncbi:hypothetical protein [Caulobacter hibisci]|uniref:Uncharacterized protein n=1 Tax=Caulobacter hibisci TaxID=2035993 RepID=A0ABS0SXX2_9CAUL|nr:hypothetical protein [Caulobacter hibisci]MBI1684476.1 hypothetical protein [Caulobacter hibisci]
MHDDPTTDRRWQTALAEFEAGPVRYRAEVRVTPAGILAVGALMSGILLSSAAIVWAAKSAARLRAARTDRPDNRPMAETLPAKPAPRAGWKRFGYTGDGATRSPPSP